MKANQISNIPRSQFRPPNYLGKDGREYSDSTDLRRANQDYRDRTFTKIQRPAWLNHST